MCRFSRSRDRGRAGLVGRGEPRRAISSSNHPPAPRHAAISSSREAPAALIPSADASPTRHDNARAPVDPHAPAHPPPPLTRRPSLPPQPPLPNLQGGFPKVLLLAGAGAGLYYAKEQGLLSGLLGVAPSAGGPVDYAKVRAAVADLLESNPEHDDGSYGPLLVRLAWHASGTFDARSGTGGSNGATMRFAPESAWGANAG